MERKRITRVIFTLKFEFFSLRGIHFCVSQKNIAQFYPCFELGKQNEGIKTFKITIKTMPWIPVLVLLLSNDSPLTP